MNYIESEVDTTLKDNDIPHTKNDKKNTETLIKELTDLFFSETSSTLDPTKLVNTKKFHDPEYWSKISTIENCERPILITLDRYHSSWQLDSVADLQLLISESTGFPFWITNPSKTTLIYLDDHDCAHITRRNWKRPKRTPKGSRFTYWKNRLLPFLDT